MQIPSSIALCKAAQIPPGVVALSILLFFKFPGGNYLRAWKPASACFLQGVWRAAGFLPCEAKIRFFTVLMADSQFLERGCH
jgi:hypothetical protein